RGDGGAGRRRGAGAGRGDVKGGDDAQGQGRDDQGPRDPGLTWTEGSHAEMSKENARPLRTVLFCAGDDEADIKESYEAGADAIVIDLEEARTPFPESERIKA